MSLLQEPGWRSPIWRPFTQMKTAPPPLRVVSGKAEILELADGRHVADMISSWWVNLHGHARKEIADAIYEQALRLEHVIFAGFTHEPAERLAGLLTSRAPENLTRVFYSDNGSTAVEVALKMACQYFWNRGATDRNCFIGFEGGYHGDTIGAMSVAGSSAFSRPFQGIMFSIETVPFPATYEGDPDVEAKEEVALAEIGEIINNNPDSYAGIFIEPLVQGAGGMRMCRPEFLRQLDVLAHELGVLLIYDEVMTGFGRTGDWFASTKSETSPDIMCLSKGISGGFMPLAATMCTEQIFEQFLSDEVAKTFFHGHSYTANPLACAAGVASFALLEAEPSRFTAMEELHRRFADLWLTPVKAVERLRFCGTIVAFDLASKEQSGYFNKLGPALREQFIERGFLIRPLGNSVYLMPPYCITPERLESAYQVMNEVLSEIEI